MYRWLVCRKQTTKELDPSSLDEKTKGSGLGEERRTLWETSRLLDNGSRDNFEAVVYIHWPCPIRSGLTVG